MYQHIYTYLYADEYVWDIEKYLYVSAAFCPTEVSLKYVIYTLCLSVSLPLQMEMFHTTGGVISISFIQVSM